MGKRRRKKNKNKYKIHNNNKNTNSMMKVSTIEEENNYDVFEIDENIPKSNTYWNANDLKEIFGDLGEVKIKKSHLKSKSSIVTIDIKGVTRNIEIYAIKNDGIEDEYKKECDDIDLIEIEGTNPYTYNISTPPSEETIIIKSLIAGRLSKRGYEINFK